MPILLKLRPESEVSLQSQIFEQIRIMILEGRLRPGDPLPASRDLSEQLSISRNTSILAYERLAAEGYIESKRSIGTFISQNIPESALYTATNSNKSHSKSTRRKKTKPIAKGRQLRSHPLANPGEKQLIADFWIGRTDAKTFPLKTWAKLIAKRLKGLSHAFTEYNEPAGLPDLRQTIADRLRPSRSIITEGSQVIIVGGFQDGLNLVCRLLLNPKTSVIIETPTYQGVAYLLESFGAKIVPIQVDGHGLNTSKLPNTKNAIIFVTPSHQYPFGVTMSLERRLELLAWADRTDSYIIEDDYDSDFRFKGAPLAALKGLDQNDRVIYIGTFSKCLGPGLRLGYVIMPDTLLDQAHHMKTLMNNGQPWLEQRVLADFMASGSFDSHIRHIRKVYYARRKTLTSAIERTFGSCDVIGTEAGMHLVWRLPEELPNASEIERRAYKAGVGVYGLSSGAAFHFGPNKSINRFLSFGYSSISEEKIDRGVSIIARVL